MTIQFVIKRGAIKMNRPVYGFKDETVKLAAEIDTIPNLTPQQPLILIAPSRIGKSWVHEVLELHAAQGFIDLEVWDQFPESKPELYETFEFTSDESVQWRGKIADELWKLESENIGTLKVASNPKIKGLHPQPFYRNSRW